MNIKTKQHIGSVIPGAKLNPMFAKVNRLLALMSLTPMLLLFNVPVCVLLNGLLCTYAFWPVIPNLLSRGVE